MHLKCSLILLFVICIPLEKYKIGGCEGWGGGLQGVSSKQDENKYCEFNKKVFITLAHTRITLGKKKNRWIRTRLTFLFCTPWFVHFHIILFFSMYPKNNWSISGFVHTSAQIHVFVSSFNDLNLTT